MHSQITEDEKQRQRENAREHVKAMTQREMNRNNLRSLVREKELDNTEHRISLARLLEENGWMGEKETYLPYHDPIWWLGHDETSKAFTEIWERALNNEDTNLKSFGYTNLTNVYNQTKMLSLLNVPRSFSERVKYLFTGKVTKK